MNIDELKALHDELLAENEWLINTINWLGNPESKGGMTTCGKHRGYGFYLDCAICNRLDKIANNGKQLTSNIEKTADKKNV